MDAQTLINTAIALVGALGGMVVKALWDGLADLRKSDKELADKVHAIETLVAGQYVKRDEFTATTNLLISKLDSMSLTFNNRFDIIISKIELKVDRTDCQETCATLIERRRSNANG